MNVSPTKPFLRPGKVIMLTLLGVLVYGVTLITLVPVGWLWQQAGSNVRLPPEIRLEQLNGKLWQGEAGLVVAGYPARLTWSLGAPRFSELGLPVNFSLATSGSSVDGNAVIGLQGRGSATASGVINVSEFEALIRRSGGALIAGNVFIDQLDLAWEDQKLTQADGLSRWDGGPVSWPMGDTRGNADFPPMRATVDSTDDGIALVVAAQDGDGPAADAHILWTGMMDLRVYKRMVDLAGQPWPDSASPGDVILRVRQPLIPGGAL